MDQTIEKGISMYRKLVKRGLKKAVNGDIEQQRIMESYTRLHAQTVEETDFGENYYKLHFMSHIIAILSAYRALREAGYAQEKACELLRKIQKPAGRVARFIYNFLDLFPFGYKYIRASLMNDMTGESGKNFDAEFPKDDAQGFSYVVHKCVYVETFREYGYPELIRVCCDNDIWCFSGMHRHVKWERKLNVGDQEGICCHDVFMKV